MKDYAYNSGAWCSLQPRDANFDAMQRVLDTGAPIRGFMDRTPLRHFTLDWLGTKLDWCANRGVRLMPMIEDKSFDGTNPLPEAIDEFAVPNASGGLTAVRWADPVRSVFQGAVEQAYKTFGSHLAFEGVALQETALGLDAAALEKFGYSPERYADGYVELVQAVSAAQAGTAARPAKRIFWFANFFAGKPAIADAALDSVIERCDSTLAFGGPDVCLVDSGSVTAKSLLERVFPRYRKFPSSVRFAHLSLPSQTQQGVTIADTVGYARSELGVSYEIYVYHAKHWPAATAVMR
jgi:hypothetical protein